MCSKSTTKISWLWYSAIYFLFIVSHSYCVQACNEDIKDALQEFRTFFGNKFNDLDTKLTNMNSDMNWRLNSVDNTLTQIKTDLALVGGTVNSIDSEMMGLGGRSSENHVATKKLTIMQGKLFTEVNNVRENMTEELNTLKKHFESFLIEELNSTMVNISTDLVKGHMTTQKLNTEVHNLKNHFESFLIEELNSSMVNISTDLVKGHITTQNLNTEVRSMRENITEELNILSNHVESLIIDNLNSNIVNITEKLSKDHTTTKKCISMQEKMFTEFYNISTKIENYMNASDNNLLNNIKLNNEAINSHLVDAREVNDNVLSAIIVNQLEIKKMINATQDVMSELTFNQTYEFTQKLDKTQRIILTAVGLPNGFEVFNDRLIRRTTNNDPRSKYDAAMSFCNQFSAKPFIPRTMADYQLYKEVRSTLDQYQWLPANDRVQEGTLQWYTGEVASDISYWDWANNQDMQYNSPNNDCLFYGSSGGPKVHLTGCDSFVSYPPICERILS
ncbi:unnamed protein product [Meganyctiphanes norvegica]|uniref:C-type lectin domain-containing protein n=1 Tax=Meganyctiphanes norvegica TaxID=48144 RepID=A0AAV2PXR5_MEGNR